MESANNGVHRGPVPKVIVKPEALVRERQEKKSGTKGDLTASAKLEAKRAAARAYYHANKGRIAKRSKEKYERDKNLPVVSDAGPPATLPKRPSKIDALVCINRSVRFLQQGDVDGGELWARFAARIMEGKE